MAPWLRMPGFANALSPATSTSMVSEVAGSGIGVPSARSQVAPPSVERM